jgi:hypothetical protein
MEAAFVSKKGIFEPTVIFFSLTNSPATFQSMMNTIFKDQILARWLKVYMDDLLITNEGDCLDIIKKALIVLKLLKENDLFVKPEKCIFFVTSVDFQGFYIKDGRIKMDPTKLKGILDWPAPTTVTQV